MRRLTVILAPETVEQITDQVLFIARDSVDNALAWESRLRATIRRIGDLPGHAGDENASDRLGYVVRKVDFERT